MDANNIGLSQSLNTVPSSISAPSAPTQRSPDHPSELATHDAPSIILAPLLKAHGANSKEVAPDTEGNGTGIPFSLSNNVNPKMSLSLGNIVSPSSLSAKTPTTGEGKEHTETLEKASGEEDRPKILVSALSILEGAREQLSLSNNNNTSHIQVPDINKTPNENLSKARKDSTLPANKKRPLNFGTNGSLRNPAKKDFDAESLDYSTNHNEVASDLRYSLGSSGTQIDKNGSQELPITSSNKHSSNEELAQNLSIRQDTQNHVRQNSVDNFLSNRPVHTSRLSEKRNSLLDLSSNSQNLEIGRRFDQNSMLSKAISNATNDAGVRSLDHRSSVGDPNNASYLGRINDTNGVNARNSVIRNGLGSLNGLNNTHASLAAGGNMPLNEGPSSSIDIHNHSNHNLSSHLEGQESLGGIKRYELEEAIRRQNRPGRKFGAKKKLWVWSWFVQDPTDPNVAVCDYCGKVVKRRSSDKGSPKKLSEHLRTHKLTKTLANNTRTMMVDGGGMNYNGGLVLLPFGEHGLNRRKSSLSLLGLPPQQSHQLPLLAQHQLHTVNYANGPSPQNYRQQGHDTDRSNHDPNNHNVQSFTNISPLSHLGHQNLTGPIPQSSAQHHLQPNHHNLPNQQNNQNLQNFHNPQNHANPQNQSGNQNFNLNSHLTTHNGSGGQGNQGITSSHMSQILQNQYGPVQQTQLSQLSRNQQNHQQPKFGNEIQNVQSHHGAHNHLFKQNPNHLNHDPTFQDMRDPNDNISPEIRLQSQKQQGSSQFGNERMHHNLMDRQLVDRNMGVEDRYQGEFANDSFDETPYSETKLLRHLLAFLHENKLSIDVIKLPSFRQLVYDLRPDSIKDLLVLDTVYSSCVEVARTSSNSQLPQESVFSMNGAINKVDPEILRK